MILASRPKSRRILAKVKAPFIVVALWLIWLISIENWWFKSPKRYFKKLNLCPVQSTVWVGFSRLLKYFLSALHRDLYNESLEVDSITDIVSQACKESWTIPLIRISERMSYEELTIFFENLAYYIVQLIQTTNTNLQFYNENFLLTFWVFTRLKFQFRSKYSKKKAI